MRRSIEIAAGVTLAVVAGWLATKDAAAWAAVGLLAAMLVPAHWLLAGALVMSGGAQQEAVAGSLILADLLMLAWLARTMLAGRRESGVDLRGVLLPLALFLGWAYLASSFAGVSLTPLLRLSMYAAVMLALALYGTRPQTIYVAVTGYAVWNVIGGVIEGQDRLVGVYVGDPAQMGALILAALLPTFTRDLRLRGPLYVVQLATVPVLVAGLWMTQTRSAWFAAIMVLAVRFLPRGIGLGRTLLIFVAVTFVGFRLVGAVTARFGLNADSATFRTDTITNGIQSGLAHPWLGTGWATVDTITGTGTVPYNLFVNVFAAVGIPALVGLCWLLIALGRRLVIHRQAPFYFFVAVLAMSVTEMTLYAGSLLTVLFFVYSGIGLHGTTRTVSTETTTTTAAAARRQPALPAR